MKCDELFLTHAPRCFVRDVVDKSWSPDGKTSFAAAGNYDYGATCRAQGMTLEECQRGAGAAAYATAIPNILFGHNHRWTAGAGTPLGKSVTANGSPDYGDQPTNSENKQVIAGYTNRGQMGCN